ncbi:hypothetical protein CBR_g41630 [Chara braunii]|uniref:Myb-like domain-containing protein n=1 Tax=Chara braunii TaxID=69332 RepID=A0A388LW63_CHABU|nr:hypothetical protein CBR_g41630 [Chara braunii]|eukprot:GBG86568.1 hypothetical protein CBR_g41630 [Chara braunii]
MTSRFMADHLGKIVVLCVVLLVLVVIILLHLSGLLRGRARTKKRRLPNTTSHRKTTAIMAGANGHERYTYGMGAGSMFGDGNEAPLRFDPSLYAHLPPHQQSLPDDDTWAPPSATLPLAYGSTQSMSEGARTVMRGAASEGAMESLLYSDDRHGICPPLDLQLSSGGQRAVTHTVLIDHPSQSTGDPSVSVQGGRSSRSHASYAGPATTMYKGGCGQQSKFSLAVGRPSGAAAGVQRTGRSASLPSTTCCVERIIARVSTMRATSDWEREAEGDDYGDGAGDGDDMDDVEGDTADEPSLQPGARNTGGGARTGAGRGRGKGNARVVSADGGGGTSVGRTYWSLDESLVLVRCKRDYDEAMAAVGSNFAIMKNKEWKWTDIAKRMSTQGVVKEWDVCMKRWENVIGW